MTPHWLLVGTIGEGVFRSQDHGESFRRTMDGTFVECDVRAILVHPDNPKVLLLGTELGLLVSKDAADNWALLEPRLKDLQIWSLHADFPQIYAGVCPARLLRSNDGGKSWGELQVPLEQHCPRIMRTRVTCVASDRNQFVWAGVEIDGVWRSRDSGDSWEKSANGLSSLDIHSLVVVPGRGSRPRRLLAATNNDLNISDDDGDIWRRLDIGKQAPRSYCRGMTQMVGRPERVLLGVGDGPPGWSGFIVVSDDAGETWREAKMPAPANSTIWNFATHAADSSLVYASSVSGQVYRSLDGGETWEKLAREFGEIRAVAWIPV